jgi:hypothetical protein
MGCCASMSVIELESGSGDFKVVEPYSLQEEHNNKSVCQFCPLQLGSRASILLNQNWNGAHMAYGRTSYTHVAMRVLCIGSGKRRRSYTSFSICSPIYSFDSVQNMYKNNIYYPACLDSVQSIVKESLQLLAGAS